ncbi:putative 2,3-dihydroxypropane-1-sulfonate exporter [Oxobacter pfennigii]|uniref:Putative 2,3-dihydroxypropane-1-sulfonate exporter n=1 Tax=Oxobacter pfennigii TaxID=36849 RepID=A0A0P8WBM5_9CLOT|nr:glycoside-pentoside-hexuronide (GPH):cation symporter [Oxobacter pfennigii]KPU45119.1 putative 2,3-dihydroxypropane-1-sulfonate exporter [Oxobacter pfennigii]
MSKLPKRVYIAYGYQEFAMGFATTMGTQYFPFFLTDVAMVLPAVAATILLIGRVVDTVDVPLIGALVEKSNMPWGKYRSWLFVAPPLIIIFNLLMFTDFNVSLPVKAAYLTIAYIMGYVFVNFTTTSRLTMLPVFTSDQTERAALSASRGQGAAIGQLVRGAIVLPLVLFLGGGDQTKGYFLTVLVFGAVIISGLYYIAYLAKDYDKPMPGRKPATLKDMVIAVATNKPLLLLVIADIFRLTATNVLMGLGMYYFKYVVGNLLLFAVYAPITAGCMLVGATTSRFLTNKYDKRTVYRMGIVVWAIGMISVYLFAGSNAAVFIALVGLAQFGMAISNAPSAAFYSDTADYSEWKTGKSVKALNMSLLLIPIKAGVAIGGSVAAFGLATIGFKANEVTPEVVQGLRVLISAVPSVIAVIAIIFMTIYSLDKNKMAEIQEELKQRAAQKS